MVKLENKGLSDVKNISYRLFSLAKHVDLDNPEQVSSYIANVKVKNSYKENLVKAYNYYVKYNGLSWDRPRYKSERKVPKIPAKEAIMKIISAASQRYATIFKILMETGVMPYELSNVTLRDIDLDKGTIAVQGFKGHSSRAFKLRMATLAMLKQYVVRYGSDKRLFPESKYMGKMWRRWKSILAEKLKEPSLKTIRLYDLRHFYGTMTYYKTKDILYVKQQMGHKKLETTLIYTQLVNFNDEDEFYSATAKTVEEARKLVEQGFEYVTEINDVKLFRKRK